MISSILNRLLSISDQFSFFINLSDILGVVLATAINTNIEKNPRKISGFYHFGNSIIVSFWLLSQHSLFFMVFLEENGFPKAVLVTMDTKTTEDIRIRQWRHQKE